MTKRDIPTLLTKDWMDYVLPAYEGVFVVRFDVSGTFCLQSYVGGTFLCKYALIGGSPAAINWDTIRIMALNNAGELLESYWLNRGTAGNPDGAVTIAYETPQIILPSGTVKLRLEQDNKDYLQYYDHADTHVVVPCNYCEVRLNGIPSCTRKTEVRGLGGGVRNFVFSGFIDNIYGKQAEH